MRPNPDALLARVQNESAVQKRGKLKIFLGYAAGVGKTFALLYAARKPQRALVDELAHTNAQGMRHPKRAQDVLELLDAGIDVYTTLNVQHLESLNDLVAKITGVVVRETVPDSMLDQAD